MLVSRRTKKVGENITRLMGDRWTISVASAHPTRPASRLLTDLVEDSWAAWGHRRSQIWVSAITDEALRVRTLSALALIGVNREADIELPLTAVCPTENLVRIRIDSEILADRIRPAITGLSLTNLSGTAAVLEGPVDPPTAPAPSDYTADRLTAVNPALPVVATITWANHYATERALSGQQLIRLHVRDSASATAWPPTFTATLRQGGSDVFVVTHFNEEGELSGSGVEAEKTSEGYLFTYEFDAATDLPSATTAIGLRVDGTSNGTSVVEIIGVELLLNLTGHTYDSGWVSHDTSLVDSLLLGDGAGMTDSTLLALPELTLGSSTTWYVHISFSDYCYVELTTASGHTVKVLTPITGHFYAGRFVACETLSYDLLSPSGLNWRRASDVPSVRTRTGGFRSNRVALEWKEADVVLPFVPNSELLERWEIFFDGLGMKTAFLLVPNQTRKECYWVICTSWNSDHVGYFTGDGDSDERYDLAFSIAEHQAMLAPRG